jgi:hypothetical protein
MQVNIDITDRDGTGFTVGIRSPFKLSSQAARELAASAARETDPAASETDNLTHTETTSGWAYGYRFTTVDALR